MGYTDLLDAVVELIRAGECVSDICVYEDTMQYVSDGDLIALANALRIHGGTARLETILIGGNVGLDGITELCGVLAGLDSLKMVTFWSHEPESLQTVDALTQLVRTSNSLEVYRIDFFDFHVRDHLKQFSRLVDAILEKGTLRTLKLYEYKPVHETAEHLIRLASDPRCPLRQLHIASYIWEFDDVEVDRGPVFGLTLDYMHFDHEELENPKLTLLGRLKHLKRLNLINCGFSMMGMAMLGRILRDSNALRVLDLTDCDHEEENICDPDLQRIPAFRDAIAASSSIVEIVGLPGFEEILNRNRRAQDKAVAALLTWLCICKYHPPRGMSRDPARIIGRFVQQSIGHDCWL